VKDDLTAGEEKNPYGHGYQNKMGAGFYHLPPFIIHPVLFHVFHFLL
jgi:hypothetical protein